MVAAPTGRRVQGVRRAQTEVETAHETVRQAKVGRRDVDVAREARPPGVEVGEAGTRRRRVQRLPPHQPGEGRGHLRRRDSLTMSVSRSPASQRITASLLGSVTSIGRMTLASR